MRQMFDVRIYVVILSILFKCTLQQSTITRYPIVLIPGDGGNQLHAKLNKQTVPNIYCSKKTSDYFLLWLNIAEIAPLVINCLIDNIKLDYNNLTRTTSNTPGVETLVKGFGQTETVEYLSSTKIAQTEYFVNIADALVKNFNYVKGFNIRGAPYDWRKAPNELGSYFDILTKLVEDTYNINNQTRVILIAHSMGNPVTLYWLNNHVTQEWKDKYIRSFVSIAAVWGGAAKVVGVFASGDNLGLPFVDPLNARKIQRASVANVFLLPTDKFWGQDEAIVTTPTRKYTVKDYKSYFADIDFDIGYEMHLDTKNLVYDLTPPNVETHCLYGTNVDTPESFTYLSDQDFPNKPKINYGNGDGTVNYRSLLGYKSWITEQKQPVKFLEIEGAEHNAILKNPLTLAYIFDLLKN